MHHAAQHWQVRTKSSQNGPVTHRYGAKQPAAAGRNSAVLDFPDFQKNANIMLNPKLLDEMSARVSSLLAATPAGEIEKNLRAALAGAFAKLDLVTREEFDVQREVLARTRAKLEALEARAAELEARSRKSPTDPVPGS